MGVQLSGLGVGEPSAPALRVPIDSNSIHRERPTHASVRERLQHLPSCRRVGMQVGLGSVRGRADAGAEWRSVSAWRECGAEQTPALSGNA